MTTTATNTMNLQTILDGMPEGVKSQRMIPWSAALQVVVPLIEINDPKRATAIPLFEEWVKDRDTELSVEQAAWLWCNFCTHFAKELTKRFSQWAYDPTSKELKNPVVLGRMQYRIWLEMHFRPWRARTQQTFWGRMQYRVLRWVGLAATFAIAFPIFFALAGLATWALVEMRGPLLASLKHLGIN